MNADELFNDIRQRGLHTNEAAAVIGYTLLIQLVGWDGLKISPRRRRKIQRTLTKLNVDIPDFQNETMALQNLSHGKGHREGVIISGHI